MTLVSPIDEHPVDGSAIENAWTVAAQIELPDPATYGLHPTAEDAIPEILSGLGPIVGYGRSSVRLAFEVEAIDPMAAYLKATQLIDSVVTLIGLDLSAVTALDVRRAQDVTDEIDELPELVGVSEAAYILGVSKQRVHQLSKRPDFPAAILRLAATPVWSGRALREYDINRRRPPLRPATT